MGKIRLLDSTRWSRLGNGQTILNSQVRKNIVFSQVLVLILVGLLVHLLSDVFRGDLAIGGFVLLAMVVTTLSYFLNERGFHTVANVLFFSFFNIIFLVLSSLVPRECAVNFLFVPLIGLTMVLNKHNSKLTLFFVCFSTASLVFLELADYNLFGAYKILEKPSLFNSMINIISSCAVLSLGLAFVIQSNRQAEQKLLQREEQLKQVNKKLDRFLYSASHDLRAPLNSIKGLVNLAALEADQKIMRQYFSMIDDRTTKLDTFILDILQFSRTSNDDVNIEPVSIQKLIEEIADTLKFMDGAKKIRLIKEFGEVDFINTDRKKLSVILTNLLSNAVKYHNQNIQEPWIKIAVTREADEVLLTVSDNGLGIEAHQQPKVFDMFYRASERSTGSGLGLFIVKETLAQMKGDITLNSKPGTGSSFTISLPEALME